MRNTFYRHFGWMGTLGGAVSMLGVLMTTLGVVGALFKPVDEIVTAQRITMAVVIPVNMVVIGWHYWWWRRLQRNTDAVFTLIERAKDDVKKAHTVYFNAIREVYGPDDNKGDK